MKKIILLLFSIFLVGCSGSGIEDFLSPNKNSFNIAFLYEEEIPNEDFYKITDFSSNYGELVKKVSISTNQDLKKNHKKLIKELKIETFPTFIIFNNKKDVLHTDKFEEIEEFLSSKK